MHSSEVEFRGIEENALATPDWVRDLRVPADTPEGIRAAVLEDLVSFAGSRAGHYRSVAMVDGVLHQTTQRLHDPTGCLDHYRDCEGRPISEIGDVTADALSTVNGFGVTNAEDLRHNLVHRILLEPAKIRSILAMSAAPGGKFAGWIGCYRLQGEEPFEPEILAEARRRVDAYIQCLEAACRLDPRPLASRATVVLGPRGETRHCCSVGRVWLANEEFAEQLQQACAGVPSIALRCIQGAVVRFQSLGGAEGQCIIAEISPAERWRLNPAVVMSLQKRKIAEFAASGASANEIGRALDISPDTVRDHLKQIYAKLEVGSRVELAECLRTLGLRLDSVRGG